MQPRARAGAGSGSESVDGPLKDTITHGHREQHDIEFVANNTGTWQFHCHNLVHTMGALWHKYAIPRMTPVSIRPSTFPSFSDTTTADAGTSHSPRLRP
jgi:hypothetical protein